MNGWLEYVDERCLEVGVHGGQQIQKCREILHEPSCWIVDDIVLNTDIGR